LPIFDCKEEKKNAGCRSYGSASGLCAFLRTGEAAFVCRERGAYFSFVSVPQQAPPNMVFSHPHRTFYP
jgi:hypothetical protein